MKRRREAKAAAKKRPLSESRNGVNVGGVMSVYVYACVCLLYVREERE